jgi:hypothetical protein
MTSNNPLSFDPNRPISQQGNETPEQLVVGFMVEANRSATHLESSSFSEDRSYQKWGTTPQEQLMGRSKMIAIAGMCAVNFLAIAALCLTNICTHGVSFSTVFGYVVAVAGMGYAIREILIQNKARNKEKEEFGITDETEETGYGFETQLTEFVEQVKRIDASLDRLMLLQSASTDQEMEIEMDDFNLQEQSPTKESENPQQEAPRVVAVNS